MKTHIVRWSQVAVSSLGAPGARGIVYVPGVGAYRIVTGQKPGEKMGEAVEKKMDEVLHRFILPLDPDTKALAIVCTDCEKAVEKVVQLIEEKRI